MRKLLPTLLLLAALAPSARAEAPRPAGTRPRPACPAAEVVDVRLPGPVAVDEIRVVVARRSPVAGAAAIRVDDGRFDRVVRVRGSQPKALRFAPALESAAFQVSLDPVFDAPRGACVERVELVRGGVTVATVKP